MNAPDSAKTDAANQHHFYLSAEDASNEETWKKIKKCAVENRCVPKVHVDKEAMLRASLDCYLKHRASSQ